MRVLPYRTVENAVNGVVITFTDITAEREAQRRQINYLESIVGTVREPILVLDPELRTISANRSFYDIFQTTPARTEGEYLYQLDKGQWDIPELRRLLGEILPERRTIESFEIEHSFPHLGRRTLNLNARRLMQEKDEPDMILLAVQDVTERRRAERKAARERYQYADYVQAAVALTRHPMLILDADLRVLSANPAFLEAFQVEMEDILEHLVYNLNHGAWDLPELRQLLEQRIPQENMVDSYELSGSFPPLGECVLHISARRLLDTGGRPAMIVLAIHNGDAQPSPEE
jgi:PAS domain S-box-containing protein